MRGDWESMSSTAECLIENGGAARIRLERFSIEQQGQKTWKRVEEESLYFLLDARGTFTAAAVGASWRYEIRPNTAIWAPGGLEHTLRNSGDACLRAIVFVIGQVESKMKRKHKRETRGGPIVLNLYTIPQRNMVSFLTRTLLVGADVEAKALLLSEYQTVLPGGWVPGHVHATRDEVCYVCSGRGTFHLEEGKKVVSAGEVVTIRPGAYHSMANEDEEVLEYVIAQSSSDKEGCVSGL